MLPYPSLLSTIFPSSFASLLFKSIFLSDLPFHRCSGGTVGSSDSFSQQGSALAPPWVSRLMVRTGEGIGLVVASLICAPCPTWPLQGICCGPTWFLFNSFKSSSGVSRVKGEDWPYLAMTYSLVRAAVIPYLSRPLHLYSSFSPLPALLLPKFFISVFLS